MEFITKYLNPLFEYLESGKLFRQPLMFLYYLIGIAACIGGIYKISEIFDGFDYMRGTYKVFIILEMLVLVALSLFSLLFWFHRAGAVKNDRFENTRFLAIPVVANLLRSFGEWLGFVLAIAGACTGVLTILLLTSQGGGVAFRQGVVMLVGGPLMGYIILVLFRYVSEMSLTYAEIANNTKDMVDKMK